MVLKCGAAAACKESGKRINVSAAAVAMNALEAAA
jgi:hypothetical protein